MDASDKEALQKCVELGFRPAHHPLGDDHHTDVPFTEEDKALGDALAYFMGTMQPMSEGACTHGRCFLYHTSTPIDEWTRVARALRIHGLKITNR